MGTPFQPSGPSSSEDQTTTQNKPTGAPAPSPLKPGVPQTDSESSKPFTQKPLTLPATATNDPTGGMLKPNAMADTPDESAGRAIRQMTMRNQAPLDALEAKSKDPNQPITLKPTDQPAVQTNGIKPIQYGGQAQGNTFSTQQSSLDQPTRGNINSEKPSDPALSSGQTASSLSSSQVRPLIPGSDSNVQAQSLKPSGDYKQSALSKQLGETPDQAQWIDQQVGLRGGRVTALGTYDGGDWHGKTHGHARAELAKEYNSSGGKVDNSQEANQYATQQVSLRGGRTGRGIYMEGEWKGKTPEYAMELMKKSYHPGMK